MYTFLSSPQVPLPNVIPFPPNASHHTPSTQHLDILIMHLLALPKSIIHIYNSEAHTDSSFPVYDLYTTESPCIFLFKFLLSSTTCLCAYYCIFDVRYYDTLTVLYSHSSTHRQVTLWGTVYCWRQFIAGLGILWSQLYLIMSNCFPN